MPAKWQPATHNLIFYKNITKKKTNVERFRAQNFTHHKNCKKHINPSSNLLFQVATFFHALVYFIKIKIFMVTMRP